MEPLIGLMVAMADHSETMKTNANNPLPENVGEYSEIQRKVIDMFQTSTGSSILDSGGAYGRAWEHNRKITNWNDIPDMNVEVYCRVYDGVKSTEVMLTISGFNWLCAMAEVDDTTKKLEVAFLEFAELEDNQDKGWMELEELFIEALANGTLGEDMHHPDARHGNHWNTYNEETLLDETFQGCDFDLDGKQEYAEYVFIQYHGGCDVRGGYTRPHIFRIPERDYMVMSMVDADAACDCGNIYSDCCGYHWYGQDFPKNATFHEDQGFPKRWIPVLKANIKPKDARDERILAENCGKHVLKCCVCHELVSFNGHLSY